MRVGRGKRPVRSTFQHFKEALWVGCSRVSLFKTLVVLGTDPIDPPLQARALSPFVLCVDERWSIHSLLCFLVCFGVRLCLSQSPTRLLPLVLRTSFLFIIKSRRDRKSERNRREGATAGKQDQLKRARKAKRSKRKTSDSKSSALRVYQLRKTYFLAGSDAPFTCVPSRRQSLPFSLCSRLRSRSLAGAAPLYAFRFFE